MHVVLAAVFGAGAFRGLRRVNKPWLFAVLLLFLFFAANLIQVTDDDFSLARGVRFLIKFAIVTVMAIGAVYIGGRYQSLIEPFFESVTTIILLIGAVLFYVSFFVFGDVFINVSLIPTAGYDRAQSSFAFALGAVAALALCLRKPNLWRFGRLIGLIVLMVLGGARGPAVIGATAMLAVFLLNFRGSNLKWLFLAVVILAALSPLVPEYIAGRYARLVDVLEGRGDSFDLSYRDELFWIAFGEVLPGAPLIGNGTGSSMVVNGRYYSFGKLVDPHSDYNLVAIEGGLLGLLLLMLVYGLPLWIAYRALRLRRSGRDRAILALYVGVLMLCFGTSAIDTLLDFSHVWLVMGLMLGFIHQHRLEAAGGAPAGVLAAAAAR